MILDASVAVPLVIDHGLTPAARDLARNQSFAAPAIVLTEVANTLWKYAMRDGLDAADILDSMEQIAALCGDIAPDDVLLREAIHIAVTYRHPVYDCLYLALASQRREPLATADRKLASLARKLDVETQLIEPSL